MLYLFKQTNCKNFVWYCIFIFKKVCLIMHSLIQHIFIEADYYLNPKVLNIL